MSTSTRDRFLTTAAALFRRQGYSGTGLKQIVAESGAPLGSLYYFFPGGKQDLALNAIGHTAARYEELLDRVFAHTGDIGQAAIKWFGWAARALEESDFADGCPIGTLASEIASTNDTLRAASQAVFDAWRSRVATQLISGGVKPARAGELATFAVASLEGAIMLARTQRSSQPLRDTGRVVAETLRSAARITVTARGRLVDKKGGR
ncbi:putative HTH-type transcriptional regulator YxaF [Mycobacterium heckeshornense]|uniref:TetR/AcrR family transcriptional regulator n=1 Tax=Mycobacterium heckeshornense TaxID=110505 RepID=UPI001942FC3B|nr:TetR/AcrR family transcriptional regulator [Mycobacterium heckeshornense]BCQ07626.1 putative HTH-type transcriptional regulator YxaF [Mycobacterium heckeshornense]